MINDSFEKKIKKYADELVKMNKGKRNPQEAELQVKPEPTAATEEKEAEEISSAEEEIPEAEEKAEEIQGTPAQKEDSTEPDSFAWFSARVFTGNGAFPVENARVIVTREDKLFTYLSTNADGTTGRIKLPSFPESNSLDPESRKQFLEYRGEVYAVGFTPKKNLLISAVGGSDIVLNVQMTPLSERVN